jgi:DNA-binding CsgD family transcriptional regulator
MILGTLTLLQVFFSSHRILPILAFFVLAKGFLGDQVALYLGWNTVSTMQTTIQKEMGAVNQFVASDIAHASRFFSGSSTFNNVKERQQILVSSEAEVSPFISVILVNLPCLGKRVLLLSYFPKGLFVNDALFEEDGDLQKRNQQLKDKEIEELKSINKRFFLVIIFSGLLIIILLSILIFIAFRQRHLVKEMVISKELNSSLNQAILTKDLERSAQNVHFSKLNNLWEVKNSAPVLAKNIGTHLGPMDLMKSEFEYRITGGKGDFYKMLLAEYPDLRPSELKLCSYLRLNLSSKELAELLNKSGRTIENTRFSIRKKMGLKPEDNLVTHLIDLENKLSNKS